MPVFRFFSKLEDIGADSGSPISWLPYTCAQHMESSLPQEIEMRSTVNAFNMQG